MRRRRFLVAAAALALLLPALCLGAQGQTRAPAQPPRVLSRLPHDPEAFTQGLCLGHGALYESTGLYGASSLRRVEASSGRVLARRELPRKLFGEGLSLCGEGTGRRLVQLTWREGEILLYDAAGLRPLGRLPLRGEGWGLACRGRVAVVSDGTSVLRLLDARTLAETGRGIAVRDGGEPVPRLNELEWVNGWIVANVWQEDRLAVIRPEDGRVALWLDLAPLRALLGQEGEAANGVAFDPGADHGRGALLLTGKRWDTLFVVALPELLRTPPGARPAPRRAGSGRGG